MITVFSYFMPRRARIMSRSETRQLFHEISSLTGRLSCLICAERSASVKVLENPSANGVRPYHLILSLRPILDRSRGDSRCHFACRLLRWLTSCSLPFAGERKLSYFRPVCVWLRPRGSRSWAFACVGELSKIFNRGLDRTQLQRRWQTELAQNFTRRQRFLRLLRCSKAGEVGHRFVWMWRFFAQHLKVGGLVGRN